MTVMRVISQFRSLIDPLEHPYYPPSNVTVYHMAPQSSHQSRHGTSPGCSILPSVSIASYRYWILRVERRHITSKPEAQTTISSSNGSLVTGSSNNARSTIAIETHIIIFVSIETSFLYLGEQGADVARPTLSKKISPEHEFTTFEHAT